MCRSGRVVTSSVNKCLRLWSVADLSAMKSAKQPARTGGVSMDDQLCLDGLITAVRFDDELELVTGAFLRIFRTKNAPPLFLGKLSN